MRRALATCAVLLTAACTPAMTGRDPDAGAGGQVACAPACLDDETCILGACQKRSCDNVRCLTGSSCVRGRCYASACPTGACADGSVCDGRRCVEASCAGISCPFGACVDGGCPSCSQLEFFDLDAGRCALKQSNGVACGAGGDCASGFCIDGVCCDSVCGEACESCQTGTCTLRPALAAGAPACFPGRCNGAGRLCATLCSVDTDCAPDAFCQRGVCTPDLQLGLPCNRVGMCASGFCSDGVCCDQTCSKACTECRAQPLPDAGALPAGICHAAPRNHYWSTCLPYTCQPGVLDCPRTCGQDLDCSGTFCGDDGGCSSFLPVTAACTRNGQCASGVCKNGMCCSSDCAGACRDCLADAGCAVHPDGDADAGCAAGGVCAQGECCNRDCRGACERCDTDYQRGTCVPVSGPLYACNGYFACGLDGGCSTSCTNFGDGCSELGFCAMPSAVCVKACDPVECEASHFGWCCQNNICKAPPSGQFCAL